MTVRINVGGIDVVWNEEDGTCLWAGAPVMTGWTETTMAGLLATMERMVGTARYSIAMQQGGRESIDGDWTVISSAPTFLEGFMALSRIAAVAGWGRWELLQVDRVARTARVRIGNNWESIAQRALGVCWGAAFTAGKLAAYFQRHFEVESCWAEQTAFIAKGDDFDEFEIRATEKRFAEELASIIASEHATRADLAAEVQRMRDEVDARARALQEKLDLIARQEEAIKVLSTPIIEVWDGVLTLPMFGIIDSRRAADMMERLLDMVTKKGAMYTIIDLTGVDFVDNSTADHIGKLVRAVELLGGKCIITGIRPAVAQTMVQIGIDLSRVVTLSTLREALRQCMRAQATNQ